MRLHRGSRCGVAVPLILLLIVSLTLLGAGVLALAEREARTSRAALAGSRGRLVAEGLANAVARSLESDTLPALPLWSSLALAEGSAFGVDYAAELRSLGGEWNLVAARGSGFPGAPPVKAALAIWGLRPLDRVSAVTSVVQHGGTLALSPDASVDGSGWLGSGEGASTKACAPYRSALDSVFGGRAVAPTAELGSGTELDSMPSLGLLGPGRLRERLPDRVAGSLVPVPTGTVTGCTASPLNWGSPTDPEGPCGSRRVALFGEGDVRMDGGEGQGLILVRGSLTLSGGAVFAGLVVVRDSLTLEGGARLSGLARAGGTVRIGPGSRVDGRACAALLALRGLPALYSPVRLAGGAWLRPF